MSTDVFAALASLLALLVTIAGWIFTARLQVQVQKAVTEHTTRFSYLHERRGKVIDDLYKQIFNMEQALTASLTVALNDTRSLEEHKQYVHDVFYELNKHFRENRLYLDEELCQMMEKLIADFGKALQHTEVSDAYPNIVMGYRDVAVELISKDIHPLQQQIEKQMRTMLGVT